MPELIYWQTPVPILHLDMFDKAAVSTPRNDDPRIVTVLWMPATGVKCVH